jgi:hypothetical protein
MTERLRASILNPKDWMLLAIKMKTKIKVTKMKTKIKVTKMKHNNFLKETLYRSCEKTGKV